MKDLLRSAKIKAGKQQEITDRKIFFTLLTGARLPLPIPQYAFAAPYREWTADYGWPGHALLLEVEGGVFSRGAHSRPGGILRDMNKYNDAAAGGWRVLRCVPGDKQIMRYRRRKADGTNGRPTGGLLYDVPALTNLAIISFLRPFLEPADGERR